MERHGKAWDGMGLPKTALDGMGRHRTARDGTGRHGHTEEDEEETLNRGCGTEQSERLPVSMHTQLHNRTENKGPPIVLI